MVCHEGQIKLGDKNQKKHFSLLALVRNVMLLKNIVEMLFYFMSVLALCRILLILLGLKSQSKRAVSATPPRPPSRRGRTMPDKIGSASSGAETANKIITVPVFHLFHKLLAGNVHSI